LLGEIESSWLLALLVGSSYGRVPGRASDNHQGQRVIERA
jgi:hypothetical protein